MRTRKEVDEQIGLAIDKNGQYPGMTYEDGVRAALDWVMGDTDEPPMEDPDEN